MELDAKSLTELLGWLPSLPAVLTDPLMLTVAGVNWGPSPLGLLGMLLWLFLAGLMWWRVRRATRKADVEGTPAHERLTYLAVRIIATSLCVLIALSIPKILPARDLLVGIGLVFDAKLTQLGQTQVTVSMTIILLAVVVLTFWGSGVLSNLTIKALGDRGVDTTGTVGVLLSLGRYVVIIIGLAVALTTAGIDLTALLTLGAVFAVTIGFALQNISQNFVSGVILLVEGAIKPGDVLEVEGRVVRVVRMGVRSTVARSMDDEDLILPNALLAQGTVKNLTMEDDSLRVKASVAVAYDSDLDEIKSILEKAAWEARDPASGKAPVVLLQTFGDSGIGFDIFVWVSDPWMAPRLRSELRLSIWRAFRDQGVKIPFPQVDVHMDPVRLVEREAG